MIIAIDGPSGTGKSTVAKALAQRLGFLSLDTGALYRALTLFLLERQADLANSEQIAALIKDFRFRSETTEKGYRYYVGEQDVTDAIRLPNVTAHVSTVAALKIVRDVLLPLQRAYARKGNCVVEGRDIGTTVFPDAEIKIYLTADPKVRAERRLLELADKYPKEIRDANPEAMRQELERRDAKDASRKIAPLSTPKDAFVIDTSHLTVDQIINTIMDYIAKKSK